MILSRQRILDRLEDRPIQHPERLVITPLLYRGKSDIFDARLRYSRLGPHFLLPKQLD